MIAAVMLLSVALQAGAQDYKQSITYPRQPPFELSGGMKAVKRSTDILALALPAAALVGTLCMRDWKGLLQGRNCRRCGRHYLCT